MGRMPPTCFPKTNNHVATNKRDTNGKTWPQAMCLHISKQKSKPLAKSLGTKQYHKSSYIIFKGLSNERRGECIKAEINASLSKIRSISGLKSSTKGGGQLQPMDENGEGYVPFIMSPNSLTCIDPNGCEYLGGLCHHPMAEMTNTKNGRTKMHANLLC